MNNQSSRSHAIFTIYLQRTSRTDRSTISNCHTLTLLIRSPMMFYLTGCICLHVVVVKINWMNSDQIPRGERPVSLYRQRSVRVWTGIGSCFRKIIKHARIVIVMSLPSNNSTLNETDKAILLQENSVSVSVQSVIVAALAVSLCATKTEKF